jgi:NTP pyrophosphatase (non-canonical NTP hydrolase)
MSGITWENPAPHAQPAITGGESETLSIGVAKPGNSSVALTFAAFRAANVARCLKWHPRGIESWSPSDWLTAVTGELGELASLLKMRNRERDGLPGNKFSPTNKQVADEIADVLTYLDLLAAALDVDLGSAAVSKFNEVSERVGFPDRIVLTLPSNDWLRKGIESDGDVEPQAGEL